MPASLPDLIQAAQRGELAAFDTLVRRFQDMAVGLAYARLHDRALAEDVAQEALLTAHQALAQLREPAAFPAWLKRIVLKHVDRVQRAPAPELLVAEPRAESDERLALSHTAPRDPLEQLSELERGARVLTEVRALPEPLCTTVVLFYAGGHTLEEIADFLEVPLGTVKRRLHDARHALEERMMDMVKESLGELRPSRSPEFAARVSELLKAVGGGDRARVAALVAEQPEIVNSSGPHPIWGGEPHPLQVAAELGKTELVTLLLDGGAEPDVRPPGYAWTALELAVHHGHRDTAELLLARGATLDVWAAAALGEAERVREIARRDSRALARRGPNDGTALHFASNVATAQVLLEAGADPLACDGHGNPPHQVLVGYPERRAAARHVLAAARVEPSLSFLCAAGDAAEVARRLDRTPALLEQFGPEYDGAARLSRGARPLHVASLHGQLEVARVLLERGAGVDARTRDGQTALHLAAGAGQLALAELLLERGADPKVVDEQHQATPRGWAEFHHARLKGPASCLEVAALLRTQGA